jgi:TP901 family phage tail tape measure protein
MGLGILGSATTLGIGLTVYMDDQFTQSAGRIRNTLSLLGKDADDFSQGMSTLSGVGSLLEGLGDKIIAFGNSSVESFSKFEHSINATRILAGLKKTDAGYKELGDTATSLSQIYGQLPEQIADAEFQLSKGGKSVAEIKQMTEAVIALGAATQNPIGGPTGTAASLLNILNTYNARADEAVHYSDIITSASHHSALAVTDFFQSLRYAGSYASALNIPFQETAASIAALGRAGLRGSQAGTSYANMLRFLETGIGIFSTKRQQTALGLLGLSRKDMIDEQGHLINMSNLIKILKQRTSTFSDNDKINVLGGIFGVRGDKALLSLMKGQDTDTHGTLMNTYDAMMDKINADAGNDITRKTAKEMMDDTQGAFAKFLVGWTNFKNGFGAALAPTIIPLLGHLTSMLNHLGDFFKSDMGQWVAKFIFGSGIFLKLLGSLIANGARFAGYIMNSSGRLTNAFAMARVAAEEIRVRLQQGANAMIQAAKAMGSTQFKSQFTSMGNGTFKDPRTGKFVAKEAVVAEAEGFAASGKGMGWIERFIGPLIGGSATFGKVLGWLGKFGSLLGTVGEWLFGWEGMLADLAVTMLTGKGIFEWLWTGFKTLFGWLFGWKDKADDGKSHNERAWDQRNVYIDRRSDEEKYREQQQSTQYKYTPTKQAPLQLNFTILPNNGRNAVEKQLNHSWEQQLASHSIIK